MKYGHWRLGDGLWGAGGSLVGAGILCSGWCCSLTSIDRFLLQVGPHWHLHLLHGRDCLLLWHYNCFETGEVWLNLAKATYGISKVGCGILKLSFVHLGLIFVGNIYLELGGKSSVDKIVNFFKLLLFQRARCLKKAILILRMAFHLCFSKDLGTDRSFFEDLSRWVIVSGEICQKNIRVYTWKPD